MITGVGLITTFTDRWAENVMAAEWTMNVSYVPPLIMVVVHQSETTHEMILESGEFGVNLAAEDQGPIVSLAGSFTRRETDKMSSHIIKTYPPKKIRAPMIKGCAVNAECKLVQKIKLGEYTAFIGEVVEITHSPERKPIIYHQGRLWKTQDFERMPTLFVTATYVPEKKSIRAEGRMRKGDPKGLVELLLTKNGDKVDQTKTTIDQRGFYQHEWHPVDITGNYTVEVRSGTLTATATLRSNR